MQQDSRLQNQEKRTLLIVLCFLTCGAIFFQIAVLLHEFKVIFSNLSHAQLISNEILSAPKIIFELFSFVFVHLFLYVLYSALIYVSTISLLQQFKLKYQYALYIGVFIWFWVTFALLVANQVYFPQSRFAFILRAYPTLALSELMILYRILATGVFLLILPFIIALLRKIIRWPRIAKAVVIASVILINMGILEKNISTATEVVKPNVIIIGIDSLRPDYMKEYMPALNNFLEKSVLFSSAVTTLGRTYPAWMSILTGDYPKTINIRDDLSPIAPPDHLLSKILQRQGYTTFYSTDDSRFSNIDKNFGFTENVSPPFGVANFLLGEINDFPLSNLLLNSKVGKLLFPYSYNNRAAFATYDPAEYIHYLTQTVKRVKQRPVFIAVHFNLPHYPYINAKSENFSNTHFADILEEEYINSIIQADKQLKRFLKALKKDHILDNAMVVILTDHGESLARNSDKIVQHENYVGKSVNPEHLSHFTQNIGIGHGTDLLTTVQNKIFLAFRLYGKNPTEKNEHQEMVSLVDVSPTILEYLHLPSKKVDGISLLPYILNKNINLPRRYFFVETGLTPESLLKAQPNIANLLKETLHYHELNFMTGQVTINPKLLPGIVAGKQRAILNYPWMLVAYPKSASDPLVLVNLENLKWTTDMQSSLAKKAPTVFLFKKLSHFYDDEIEVTLQNAGS